MLITCILLLFYGFRSITVNSKKELPQSDFKILCGIFISCIVLGHMALETHREFDFRIMHTYIYILVSSFFFMSGYGLNISYRNNSKYLKQLLIKRIPSIIKKFIIANIIYCIFFYLTIDSYRFSMVEVVFNLKKGIVFLDYSWFIFALLYLYFLFLISHFFKCKSTIHTILLLGYLLYLYLCISLEFPDYWITSISGFFVGIYFNDLRTLCCDSEKNVKIPVFVFISSFFIKISNHYHITNVDFRFVSILVSSVCVFCLFSWMLSYSFLDNPLFKFIGQHSLEIYLFQGIAIRICMPVYDSFGISAYIFITFVSIGIIIQILKASSYIWND